MKPKKNKRADELLTITRPWQITFVAIFVIYWLAIYVYEGIGYFYHPGYMSAGTFAIEISFALYPLVYFTMAFLLLPHHQNQLKRWFMAIFIALIGMMTWILASMFINRLWPSLMYWSEKGTGIWDTFGGEWLQMITAGILFAIFLQYLRKKGGVRYG
jgi:hypothetical protein